MYVRCPARTRGLLPRVVWATSEIGVLGVGALRANTGALIFAMWPLLAVSSIPLIPRRRRQKYSIFYWRPPASTVPKKIPVLTTGDPAFTLRIAAPTVPTIPVYATIAALVFSLIERFVSFRSSSSRSSSDAHSIGPGPR